MVSRTLEVDLHSETILKMVIIHKGWLKHLVIRFSKILPNICGSLLSLCQSDTEIDENENLPGIEVIKENVIRCWGYFFN